MTEFERFDRIIEKIDQRLNEINGLLDEIKKKDIQQTLTEMGDEICKTRCKFPEMFCWDGRDTQIEGMEYWCRTCPLMKGYKKCR